MTDYGVKDIDDDYDDTVELRMIGGACGGWCFVVVIYLWMFHLPSLFIVRKSKVWNEWNPEQGIMMRSG